MSYLARRDGRLNSAEFFAAEFFIDSPVWDMRRISFQTRGAVGPYGKHTEAALADFLLEIPQLFHFGYVPTIDIVNAVLADGISDAGTSGGCRWTSFAITQEEYSEALDALREPGAAVRGRSLLFIAVPEHIKSKNEWYAWVMRQELGIPYAEHLHLIKAERDLNARTHATRMKGNSDLAAAIQLRWNRAAADLVEFTRPYIQMYRERGGRYG